MAQLNPASALHQWVFWSPTWSWSPSYPLLWLVSSASMVWSSLLSSCKEVRSYWLKKRPRLVDENYTNAKGYKHLVSGMCCGFSGLVSIILLISILIVLHFFRLRVSLLVSWEILAWEWTQSSQSSLSVWSWFSSSPRPLVSSDWLSPSSCPARENTGIIDRE